MTCLAVAAYASLERLCREGELIAKDSLDKRRVSSEELESVTGDLRLERGGGVTGDDPTIADECDAVTLSCLFWAMRTQEDTHLLITAESSDTLPSPLKRELIKPRRRLIHEEESRRMHKAPGKLQAPPHPPREILHALICSITQVCKAEQLLNSRKRLAARDPMERRREEKILSCAKVRIETRVLENNREGAARCALLRLKSSALVAERPLLVREETSEDREGCALSAPVRAKETKNLSLSNGKREPLEDLKLLPPDMESIDLKEWLLLIHNASTFLRIFKIE